MQEILQMTTESWRLKDLRVSKTMAITIQIMQRHLSWLHRNPLTQAEL